MRLSNVDYCTSAIIGGSVVVFESPLGVSSITVMLDSAALTVIKFSCAMMLCIVFV